MTLEEAFVRICSKPEWAWCGTWFRLGEIIVQTPEKSWATRNPDDECPHDVTALGCSGEDVHGRCSWIGFDLDVGHGKRSYQSTFVALQAARRLHKKLGPLTEIRASKSGNGFHVRHLMDDRALAQDDAPDLVRKIVNELGIRVGNSEISRQQFWCWTRNKTANGFKLVQAVDG